MDFISNLTHTSRSFCGFFVEYLWRLRLPNAHRKTAFSLTIRRKYKGIIGTIYSTHSETEHA